MEVISLDVLLPSWWEIEVTFAAALLVIAVYSLFGKIARLGFCGGSGGGVGKEDDRLFGGDEMAVAKDPLLREYDDKEKLELLAAKNLIGANLNGTSDPYAIITCGDQKRFR
ncbi:hypothetical protein MA16_Dca027172 [Dendrobium catenatum]|uniref:C2 domain-containing protein n=1 Tax=Dendrobium catenatum TaxID=906689 RepID=A0A2I0VT61_9ASPA|nr:hypothetical protein MA16_Dca027172 [Dendrobium catenatum]